MSRNRLRWDDIPDGASIAINKKAAMDMRGGGPSTFMWGMATGAACVLLLQGCGSDDKKDDPAPKPSSSVSSTKTTKPSN